MDYYIAEIRYDNKNDKYYRKLNKIPRNYGKFGYKYMSVFFSQTIEYFRCKIRLDGFILIKDIYDCLMVNYNKEDMYIRNGWVSYKYPFYDENKCDIITYDFHFEEKNGKPIGVFQLHGYVPEASLYWYANYSNHLRGSYD